jgi:hypothetical protein
MSTLSIRLPDSMHNGVRSLAEREGISINQFVASAVAEKLAAVATESYLRERAGQGRREDFEAALAQVPDVPDRFEDESGR